MISRSEVIDLLGGIVGKKALNKMERARPIPTGRTCEDKGVEYCAVGVVLNNNREKKSLSVFYSIHTDEMPPEGVFKVRPPCLVPIGYLVMEP